MRSICFHRAALLAGAALGLGLPLAAQAQDADAAASDEPAVADIIVTATRQDKSLQDTPMAVDVVSGAEIRNLNIFDTKEIQTLSPGLELSNASGRNNTATLRGIAFDPDGGSSPAVEVFYNEIPLNANTAFTAIYDLGQVEVLRGPQGLFRGKTSPAGALLFGTQRADLDAIDGYVQASGTTRRASNLQGAVSVPLVSGKLAVRISGLYDDNDVSSVTNLDGRRSSSTTKSGRVSVAVRPVESWTTHIMYQYLDTASTPFVAAFGPGATVGGVRTGPALSIEDRKSVTEGDFRFTNTSHVLTVNSSLDLGFADLAGNFGLQDSRLRQRRDEDTGNAIPGVSRNQHLFTTFEYLEAELRLQSKSGSRFSWSLAGDFHNNTNYVPLHSDERSFTPGGVPVGTCIPALDPMGVSPACYDRASVELTIHDKGWGAAATVGYKITDAIEITGGIRYKDYVMKRNQLAVINPVTGGGFPLGAFTQNPADYATFLDLCQNFGPGSPFFQAVDFYKFNEPGTKPFITRDPGGVCGIAAPSVLRNEYNLWSGGANLNWEVNRDLTAYFSYGRTTRGGPPSVAVTANVGPQYLQSRTETSDGFELGFKSYLADRRISLNVALFYQTFDNFLSYQSALFAIEPTGRVVQIEIPTNGDAETKGVEAQFTYRPNDNVDLGLNASYVKSRYTSPVFCNRIDANGNPILPNNPAGFTPGPNVDQTATCTGLPLSDSPEFTMNASGEVRFPTGNVTPFVRGLLNLRPGFDSEISNYTYRAFTKIDLFAGVRGGEGAWEISAFVKNLLNQARVSAVSPTNSLQQATDGSYLNSGYRTGAVSAPREFGVTAKYNF